MAKFISYRPECSSHTRRRTVIVSAMEMGEGKIHGGKLLQFLSCVESLTSQYAIPAFANWLLIPSNRFCVASASDYQSLTYDDVGKNVQSRGSVPPKEAGP